MAASELQINIDLRFQTRYLQNYNGYSYDFGYHAASQWDLWEYYTNWKWKVKDDDL